MPCAAPHSRRHGAKLLYAYAQATVPKLTFERVNELMRACAAAGTYKTNPIERIFRDIATGRGHIANNTDIYVRAHGAVMLGLPNSDPYI